MNPKPIKRRNKAEKETVPQRIKRLGYTTTLRLYHKVPVLKHAEFDAYMGNPHFFFPSWEQISDADGAASSETSSTCFKIRMHRPHAGGYRHQDTAGREVIVYKWSLGRKKALRFPWDAEGIRALKKLLAAVVTPAYLSQLSKYRGELNAEQEKQQERRKRREAERQEFREDPSPLGKARRNVVHKKAALRRAEKKLRALEDETWERKRVELFGGVRA